jgi:hypothetical protein
LKISSVVEKEAPPVATASLGTAVERSLNGSDRNGAGFNIWPHFSAENQFPIFPTLRLFPTVRHGTTSDVQRWRAANAAPLYK